METLWVKKKFLCVIKIYFRIFGAISDSRNAAVSCAAIDQIPSNHCLQRRRLSTQVEFGERDSNGVSPA